MKTIKISQLEFRPRANESHPRTAPETLALTADEAADVRRKLAAGALDVGDDGQAYLTLRGEWVSADDAHEALVRFGGRRRADILSALASHDHGDGGLGVIVDQALADDPAVTVAEVREIVLQAERDAADEASR